MRHNNLQACVCVAALTMFAAGAAAGDAVSMEYDIRFKEKSVGSQTVRIEREPGGSIKIAAESNLEIRVLFVRYTFNDKLFEDENGLTEFDLRKHGATPKSGA